MIAVLLFASFIWIERRAKAPLVPLRLFRSRSLVGGNLMLFIIGLIVSGSNVILSLFAQEVLDYTAVRFALTMMSAVWPVL